MTTRATADVAVTIRAFDPAADFGPAAAFMREVNRHDRVDWLPTEAMLANEWRASERFDPELDAVVARAGSEIVGLADTSWRERGDLISHQVDPIVRPSWRRRGLGRRLLAWSEARARAVAEARPGDGRQHALDVFFEVGLEGIEAFAAAAGYRPHTHGYLMRRQLSEPIADADLPAGLEIRPVRPEDHRAIWDADVEAFRDHAEPMERDEHDFERWFGQPGLDTALWRVAWAGDEVVGSVMTMIWTEENAELGVKRGWLEHVSVRRPWRRRGVATALIADSLRMLRDGGFEEAMLGVHGENPTGAVGVYEHIGFRVHRRWQLWRKPLAAGIPA